MILTSLARPKVFLSHFQFVVSVSLGIWSWQVILKVPHGTLAMQLFGRGLSWPSVFYHLNQNQSSYLWVNLSCSQALQWHLMRQHLIQWPQLFLVFQLLLSLVFQMKLHWLNFVDRWDKRWPVLQPRRGKATTWMLVVQLLLLHQVVCGMSPQKWRLVMKGPASML